MGLNQDEIDACQEAFNKFDKDGSGNIDAWELKQTLQAMGQNPTDEEVFQMMAEVDDDGSGSIEFSEFLKVIESQKTKAAAADDESDTVDAWIALGGDAEKTGVVKVDKLRAICKKFELTIDIDQLVREIDTDNSGNIEYEEFKAMLQ